MGVFTGTLTAGAAIGLVLGGVLTSELSWRWCLYVNIAFSLVTLLGAPRLLPDLPGHKEVKIDLWSALLASVGMAALVYALGEAVSAGWGSAEIICSLITAAVLLGAFVLRQVGHSDRLLPLRVVVNHNRGWTMVGLIVNGLSTFGMMLILTYQLQAVLGYSALRTGLALVPFALATAFGSAVLARFLMVRVPPRWLVAAHAAAGVVTSTVHGFTVAMVWGAVITLAAAVPIAVFVNAKAPARPTNLGRPTQR